MSQKITRTWFDVHTYAEILRKDLFNDEQINFLIDQRNIYEDLKRSTETVICETCNKETEVSTFDDDTYEREMWFTMNRSGLFEDDEENLTGITDWTPNHTREYITEI